jgi:GDP-L-fucose synthase
VGTGSGRQAGLVVCWGWGTGTIWSYLLPVNIYGPSDNSEFESSHVILAMIQRFPEAKEAAVSSVAFWETERQGEKFMYVEDVV